MIFDVIKSSLDVFADHWGDVGEIELGEEGVVKIAVVKGLMWREDLEVQVDWVVVVEEGEGLVEDELCGGEKEARVWGDECCVAHCDAEAALLVDGLVLGIRFRGREELAEEFDLLDDDLEGHLFRINMRKVLFYLLTIKL